jgi:Cu/Ag efflux protein CusF
MKALLVSCALLLAAVSCARPAAEKQYELRGQIISLDPSRNEVLIKHEDIAGFMPAMTMPFRVDDPALLEGREAGASAR